MQPNLSLIVDVDGSVAFARVERSETEWIDVDVSKLIDAVTTSDESNGRAIVVSLGDVEVNDDVDDLAYPHGAVAAPQTLDSRVHTYKDGHQRVLEGGREPRRDGQRALHALLND